MFCRGGACQVCNQGASCAPANRCKVGTVSCSSGSEQCSESGNERDDTQCGESRECQGGICQDCGRDDEGCCGGGRCRSANFECRNDRCVRRCGPSDGQCPAGCASGQDVDCKKPNGQPCNAGVECESDNCRGNLCCGNNQHGCNGACRSDTSVDSCGLRCDPCPEPANSNAACGSSEQCSFSCNSGFMKSPDGRACVPNCGEVGQNCCGGFSGTCRSTDSVACVDGKCQRCGQANQSCCSGNVCRSPLVCRADLGGRCTEDCGFIGRKCCGGFSGTCSGGNSVACVDGMCQRCGEEAGQPCCRNSCNPPLVCRADLGSFCANP